MTTTNQDTRYITTSIPYVNGAPHIGHALEFAQADAIARYHRLLGRDVRLLTGTDDNSLKNVLAAEREGIPTTALVERNAATFATLARAIGLTHDDFIRTSSDPRHTPGVHALWQAADRNGDLYKRSYRGLYCVGCEQFYAVDELEDGRCSEHGTVPETVEEENYFFCLSRYQAQLEELIDSGQLRIIPESRRNEVRAFIARVLEDFSVSRSRTRARGWGIAVPGDPSQVLYVWFDALANYITALGYDSDRSTSPHGETSGAPDVPHPSTDPGSNLYTHYWLDNPHRLHVIGKGILRFHAVYWPAMLLSAGVPLPTDLLVHGYLTIDGQKISKSLGNGVDPLALVDRYGADAVRYWLLRAVPTTADSDYTDEKLERLYTAELANDFGNLVQRATSLIDRFANASVPAPGTPRAPDETRTNPAVATPGAPGPIGDPERRLRTLATALPERVEGAFDRLSPDAALQEIAAFVGAANRYAEETAPWKLAKQVADPADPRDHAAKDRLRTALYHLAEAARLAAWYLSPFIPTGAAEAHRRLAGHTPLPDEGTFGALKPGTPVTAGAPLYPRFTN